MQVYDLLFPALMIGVFWFLLLKPQSDERKRHEALLASLSKDDRVILGSGIHGTIHRVDEETVELEIAKGTRITVDRRRVLRREGEPDPTVQG